MEETAWDLPLGNKRVERENIPYCVGKVLKQESELLVGRAEPRLEDRSKNKTQALCHDLPHTLSSRSPGKQQHPTEVPSSLWTFIYISLYLGSLLHVKVTNTKEI